MFFNTSVVVRTACFMFLTSSVILILRRTLMQTSFSILDPPLQQFSEEERIFVKQFSTKIDKDVQRQFEEKINYFDNCIYTVL